ncbi:MAG: tyrosine-type recombinase/integrase [Candidatus Rokubacteria bacterium]|nr:tyrosine-type recombinase/integrase [Candidatus Rokubacteria bacterium]
MMAAPALTPERTRVPTDEPPWQWPVDVTVYDRSPQLSAPEARALALIGEDVREWRHPERHQPAWHALDRLVRPLTDVRAVMASQSRRQHGCADAAVAAILRRCGHEGSAYWGWSATTWVHILGATQRAFSAVHPAWVDRQVRHYLIALPYLLGCFTDLRPLGNYQRATLAEKVFGQGCVRATVARVAGVLCGWGYQNAQTGRAFPRVLCETLLLNRSPRVHDLSPALLDDLRRTAGAEKRSLLFQLQLALATLGVMDPPAAPVVPRPAVEGVAASWQSWVHRWETTSTVAPTTRRHVRLCLLKAGRWLAAEHLAVEEPAAWTRELCAAYVAAVDRMRVGDYAQRCDPIQHLVGTPLSPRSKEAYLGALRQFFRDAQEWGWIPRRFDPTRALATPRAVKALIGPAPRVIADDVWAKLLWAGLHLESADLVPSARGGYCYPVELVRALAVTWLFSGLRSDEIARLRTGCVRWQSSPEAPQDAVCLLDIPAHKTGAPFTKPVDPLVGRAIEAWEAVRPVQPLRLDPRTSERVSLLFCLRAKRVAREYLNHALIPALCRKAGVPRADARGRITSHRARSTIASQLYNAKEPMTLFELQAWLGHRSPQSTQHYTQITPTRLAQAYADAGYFARNVRTVEVLIDREAVRSGAAASGTPWQYFDLGHGYCTYNFFEQCPHRMACARCDFYVPKVSTRAQLLEAQASLQRMLVAIPLTVDERAAVDDGAEAVERLLARLADTPTPAGRSPREILPPPGPLLLTIKPLRQAEGA